MKIGKKAFTWAISVISFAFIFMPEELFKKNKFMPQLSDTSNVIINRLALFIVIWIFSLITCITYLNLRKKVEIKGRNYSIIVCYGDIFKQKCKKVIPFDECFTTIVGDAPSDINPKSICGQYLNANPSLNICGLLSTTALPIKGKSKFKGKDKYESGRILPNRDYLLMAFAKLDKNGLGRMTREEYLDSLNVLWEEIDKYYGQQDVSIPIIGSGVTRIGDGQLTQQELLEIIIDSYRLSVRKIKKPNKLYIICRKCDDFSINKIESD